MATIISTVLILGLICRLSSCQTGSSTSSQSTPPTVATAADSIIGAPTVAATQAIVIRHLRTQPQANLYQLDSMRIMEVDTHWQVLVPRIDWAKRMPNSAAFDVDKQTGRVTSLKVK